MLTDVFFRRYADTALFDSYTDNHLRFLGQAAQLLVDEVLRRNEKAHKDEKADPATIALRFVHSVMCRELGIQYLTPARYNRTWKAPNGNDITQSFEWSVANQTTNYLTFAYDDSLDADSFLKRRMSFIELAFQRRAKQLVDRRAALEAAFARKDASVQLVNSLTSNTFQIKETKNLDDADAAFSAQALELNERFRQAGIPLAYHNNLVQISDDKLIDTIIDAPFWALVADPKWQNVDLLLKEAVDKRDSGDRDAVSPAMQGLESVIKILSDDKGWTRGVETGAAGYIDNLVKERNGERFIAVWEKDALVKLFGEIRNYFGHGPGSAPLPSLRPEQTAWVIGSVMVWVRSLVRRA